MKVLKLFTGRKVRIFCRGAIEAVEVELTKAPIEKWEKGGAE